MASVTGIVLAAGQSRRLGRPKQTLPFGDTTLLGWTLRTVEASSLDRVIVVLGGAGADVVASLTPQRAEIVHNHRFVEGPFSSVLAGLDAAEPCDAVMLLLGDMPAIDAGVIDTVASEWRAHRPWGAVTSYRGELGHPVIFASDSFATLRAVTGPRPVWNLVLTRTDDVSRVHVDRPLPRDVDTWQDYQDVLRSVDPQPPKPSR
jgi:molybdenum cofactor cytidylyltransferase